MRPLSGTILYLQPHSLILYPIPDRVTLGRTGWYETTLLSHQSRILHYLILSLIALLWAIFCQKQLHNWIQIYALAEPEWPNGIQYCAHLTDGYGFKSKPNPPPILVEMSANMWIKKVWLQC